MPASGLQGTASGPPGSCSFLASGASAPINRGLLCAVLPACLVYPASWFLLPHCHKAAATFGALAVSFLLLPHGSCLFKPSAALWISQIQGFVSWRFCSSRLLLHRGSYCFMASVSFLAHCLLLHGFCYLWPHILTCLMVFAAFSLFLLYSVSDILHPTPRLPLLNSNCSFLLNASLSASLKKDLTVFIHLPSHTGYG